MTWYAHRAGGTLASLHREIQPSYAEEALADDHPEVAAFLAAAQATPAEAAADEIGASRALAALVRVLAARFGISEQQLVDQIAAQAG
jgi:hypothetical protein